MPLAPSENTSGHLRTILAGRYAPAVVFVLALSLRLIYIYEIRDIGFFDHPVSDGLVYETRAGEIAAGDWLGTARFVHAPLYAYVLGMVRLLVGEGPWAPRCVQAVFGAAACALLVLAGRRFFQARGAVAAGLLLAVYPPALFFDGLVQKTSLALLLGTLLLWLAAWCRDRPSRRRWLAAGLTLGLLSLTRQNALALMPVLLAWLWSSGRRIPRRRRLNWTAACVVGTAVPLLLWGARNQAVTGSFVLTTPNLGQNFAMGNHPMATGTYLPQRRGRASGEHEQWEWTRSAEQATGRVMSAGEVSDYHLAAALRYIAANPTAWFRLMGRKWLLVWNAYEAPDTEDYYVYQEWSPLLRGLDGVFHFGVLCPLGLAGLVLTIRRYRTLWVLYAWLIVTALGVAVFVVFARYRFPLVPVLAMFAGAGFVELVSTIRARRIRRPAIAAAVLVAVAIVVNWPGPFSRRPYAFSYTNHAVVLADGRRSDDAMREVEKALRLSPDDVDAHMVKASVLLDAMRYEAAMVHYQWAAEGDPHYAAAHCGIGDTLMALGRFEEAEQRYSAALQAEPGDAAALTGLATAAARQGRFAEAIERFNNVLARSPKHAEAHLNLGNTYAGMDQPQKAAFAYALALLCRPDYTDALYNLGVLEVRRGQLETAAGRFRRVLEWQPDHAAARESLRALEESGALDPH